MNKIINKTARFGTLCLLACLAVLMSGCNDNDVIGYEIHDEQRWISFTENPDIENFYRRIPEFIYVDSSEQTLSLHGTPIYSNIPEINNYVYAFPEPKDIQLGYTYDWDNWKSANDGDCMFTDFEKDFYHVYTEKENGKPIVKINLKANDTDSERRFYIHIFSDKKYDRTKTWDTVLFGIVAVVQAPRSEPA